MRALQPWENKVHEGDARELITDLPDDSIHSVVTSPPTYNMRDYNSPDQIGNEETLEEYVQNLTSFFSEVKRVLRPRGSLWVNLSDKYRDKRKTFLPYRVALHMEEEDGWIPRNDVVWKKTHGGKPESTQDRLSQHTERLMHFVLQKDYYYDLHPIREPKKSRREQFPYDDEVFEGKNPGDVFEFSTVRYPEAPIPVFPTGLVEKPIKATVPKKVCSECGAAYEREIDDKRLNYRTGREPEYTNGAISGGTDQKFPDTIWLHVGWKSTCDCHAKGVESGIVLDPFLGSGTTAKVAKEYDRRYIGFEVNGEYVDISRREIDPTVAIEAESALSW